MTMTKNDFDGIVTSIRQLESGWLRDLQTILAAELKSREKEDMQKARLEIQRIAKSVGYSVEQLLAPTLNKDGTPRKSGSVKGRTYGPLPPMYADPANPSRTWSGRGLTPQWIVTSGKPKEEFLITKGQP